MAIQIVSIGKDQRKIKLIAYKPNHHYKNIDMTMEHKPLQPIKI